MFRPFYRVEQSRSRDTGGVGLGLAVARTVFRAHGGDVVLSNRPRGRAARDRDAAALDNDERLTVMQVSPETTTSVRSASCGESESAGRW